ncbi:hypothetical protein Barb7_00494 [Bacteroidales bacterium Barb7]|nr:hypothetical protein Barb7_00494 [Bacteroidales bacterium Barb7]
MLIEIRHGIRYHVTVQCRRAVAVRKFQRVQFKELFPFIDSFNAPFQRKVSRQKIFHQLQFQVFGNLCHVLRLRNADGGTVGQLSVVLVELQQGEQRVFFGEVFQT